MPASPYQAAAMKLSTVEYYRRLIIVMVRKLGGTVEVDGAELLATSASDGLFLRFPKSGVILRTEAADEAWEAHVGTAGANEPSSWIAPTRAALEEAMHPQRAKVLDDATTAQAEKKQKARQTVRQMGLDQGAEAVAKSGRVPWYAGEAPAPKEEPA
jgi:hypothetical protein